MARRTRLISFLLLLIFLMLIPNEVLAASKMPQGTKVGKLLVEKKKEAEISKQLESEIADWQAQNDLQLVGKYETIKLSREVFDFDLEETLANLRENTKRKMSTFFKRPKNSYTPITVRIDENHRDIEAIKSRSYIDDDAVKDELLKVAQDLADRTIPITYLEDEEVPLDRVANVRLKTPELSQASLSYLIDELNGVLIEPEMTFSLIESVDIPERLLNSRDETSFLASGLYSLFLQADFDILTRHQPLTLPPYGEVGLNAEVDFKAQKDLIVINESETTYRMKIKQTKDETRFSLEAKDPQYSYKVSTKEVEEIKPRTIYRYSKKIAAGEEELIQSGQNGLSVELVRTKYKDDKVIDEELISRDLYLPSPHILLVSPEELEEEEKNDAINQDEKDDEELLLDDGMTAHEADKLTDEDLDTAGEAFESVEEAALLEYVKETEERQKNYEQYLDRLLDDYKEKWDKLNEEEFEKLKDVEAKIEKLEEAMRKLIEELLNKESIDQSFKDFIKEFEGGEEK